MVAGHHLQVTGSYANNGVLLFFRSLSHTTYKSNFKLKTGQVSLLDSSEISSIGLFNLLLGLLDKRHLLLPIVLVKEFKHLVAPLVKVGGRGQEPVATLSDQSQEPFVREGLSNVLCLLNRPGLGVLLDPVCNG